MMQVAGSVDFDVQLSAKECKAIKALFDSPCEVEQVAKLTVSVKVKVEEKQATNLREE